MPNTCGMPTCERVSGGPKSSETPPVGLAIKVAAHEGRKRKGWSGAAPGVHAGACAGLWHQRAAGDARILRGHDCALEARRPHLQQQLVVVAQQRP